MRRLMLSFVFCLTLGVSNAAWAQEPPPPPGGPGHAHPHDLVREHAEALGISDETVQRIQEIAEGSREEMARLQDASREARVALGSLLDAEQPDREAIMDQIDAVGEAETALLRHQLSSLLSMRELLTPAQVSALEAMNPGGPGGGPPPHSGGPPPGPPPPLAPGR